MPAGHDIVLECRGVAQHYGDHPVLHDINLQIGRGQIVGLVGPSGCGKSTLLRAILGTQAPGSGAVLLHDGAAREGREIRCPGADRGIVFQAYSLFPFLTARENVALGPKLHQTSIPFRLLRWPAWRALRRAHLQEADALLERVGLGRALRLYPRQMSGGMQQRVAIAQALIMKPAILLLDEPFGALDEAVREELQRLLLTLYLENCEQRRAGRAPAHTIFLVTHELNEAIFVCDRVLGLSQYWDWRAAGHARAPGATIVYDKAAPIYRPDDPRDHGAFVAQREEIRRVVFDPEHRERGRHVVFWDQVRAGSAGGVLSAKP